MRKLYSILFIACALVASVLLLQRRDAAEDSVVQTFNDFPTEQSTSKGSDLISISEASKSFKHGPDCAHCIAEAAKNTSTIPKPLNHEVLPSVFGEAFLYDETSKTRYIPIDNQVFNSLREKRRGDLVSLILNDGLILETEVLGIKTYPQDGTLLKGVLKLKEPEGQLSFFQTSEELSASIVFNEKSAALTYEEGEKGASLVETEVSGLYCAHKGAIYPLSHPSNGEGFLPEASTSQN